MELTNRIAGAAVVIGLGLSVAPARAAYVVDLREVGSDVVATGSGTIDLTDLSLFQSSAFSVTAISPSFGAIVTGPASGGHLDVYSGFSGPLNFGSGSQTSPSSGGGDLVGISGLITVRHLGVPAGYMSGSALSDTMTFDNTTFASLGATPGTYTWTWGSGAHADSFTLDIIAATVVPEPSTWAMMLVGFAGLGFAGWRARGGFRLAA
jgi:hypothetical protein